nr:MAG TPA: hypothetical protein [Microviridae sp.]
MSYYAGFYAPPWFSFAVRQKVQRCSWSVCCYCL